MSLVWKSLRASSSVKSGVWPRTSAPLPSAATCTLLPKERLQAAHRLCLGRNPDHQRRIRCACRRPARRPHPPSSARPAPCASGSSCPCPSRQKCRCERLTNFAKSSRTGWSCSMVCANDEGAAENFGHVRLIGRAHLGVMGRHGFHRSGRRLVPPRRVQPVPANPGLAMGSSGPRSISSVGYISSVVYRVLPSSALLDGWLAAGRVSFVGKAGVGGAQL